MSRPPLGRVLHVIPSASRRSPRTPSADGPLRASPDGPPATAAGAWTRARLAALLGLALVALVPPLLAIWSADVFPTHDGPKNLYAAHIRFHLEDPQLRASFDAQVPSTAFGFALLYAALERLTSWQRAYGLSWTILVLGTGAAYAALVHAIHPRRWPLAFLGFAASLSWAVFMGFINYVGSLCLGLLAVAVGLATPTWSVRRELSVAALVCSACAFHPFGAQVAIANLLLARALTAPPGQRIRRLGAVVLMAVSILFVSLATADRLEQLHATGMVRVTETRLSLLESLESFGRCFLSGPAWRAWPLVALGAVGYAAEAFETARVRGWNARASPLLAVGLGAVAAAIVLPLHGMAWEYLSPRFLPIAILFGVALVPLERLGPRAFAGSAVAALSFHLLSNGWAIRTVVEWQATWADAYEALGAESRPGRSLLPIVALPDSISRPAHDRARVIPYASPIANLGQLYGVDRNAVVPYSFSSIPGLHLLHGKVDAVLHAPRSDYGGFFEAGVDPALRRRTLVDIASAGAYYDDVLFFGSPEDADQLLALGYAPEVRRGRTFIGHFVGCPLRIRVVGASGDLSALATWQKDGRVTYRATFAPPRPDVVDIPRAACTGVWVALFSGGRTCAGSDDRGFRFIATERGRSTEVECRLER